MNFSLFFTGKKENVHKNIWRWLFHQRIVGQKKWFSGPPAVSFGFLDVISALPWENLKKIVFLNFFVRICLDVKKIIFSAQ